MGSLQAMEMAASGLPLDAALHWHLRSNHFPPVPTAMIGPAKRAIDRMKRGEHDARIRLPDGITHRRYGRLVPAWVIAEQLHLDAFID